MKMPTLYNGLSGVIVHETGLTSVADNMANVSTYGYKPTRANFDDMLYTQINGGAQGGEAVPGHMQLGNGADVSMQNMMYQGALEHTENVTDLAVSGRGFFAVRDLVSDDTLYTRAGDFVIDQDGYMVTPTGHRLQGFSTDPQTGTITSQALSDILIPVQTEADAVATSYVEKVINLNADDPVEFQQDVSIDPNDASTYNFSTGVQVYDSAGETHNMVVLYQNLESYSGAAPADSSGVWKAAVFERVDGALVANPPDSATGEAQNYFYMHFDTNGHMVGTSGAGVAAGEVRAVTGAVVASGSSPVSNRAGETFSYTGDGAAQTFISNQDIALNGAWGGADTLTLTSGGVNYVYDAATYATGAEVAAAINADSPTTGVWASYMAATDTIVMYGSGASPVSTVSSDGSITVTSNTMDELASAINNGRSASAAIAVTGPIDGGEQITINGSSITLAFGDDAAAIAAAINSDATLSAQVTASASGDSVFIRSDSNDSDSNSWGLSVSGDADNDLVPSGATLAGGMDGTAATLVEADTTASGAGVALQLSRDDAGAAATVSVTGGTLGANLATPLDFADSTQTTAPSGGSTEAAEGGERNFTFTFTDSEGVSITQDVTFDYIPGDDDVDVYVGSTHSSGTNEITFLDQDGATGGALENLEITDTGIIWGAYSDGQILSLGAVALTGFISPGELVREGDNMWMAVEAAGEPVVGSPLDENDLGTLESMALEASKTDVALEMVNMISYQRAFQMNSKSITTADEMLKTAINLKG